MTINLKILKDIQNDLNSFPNSKLIIVSKNRSKDDIIKLLEIGYKDFGENRVQEAYGKFDFDLRKKFDKFKLHLIGPLQSNKTKLALQLFDTIQSLDRKKIIQSIAEESKKIANLRTKNYFIQVNIGYENQKSGVLPGDTWALIKYAKELDINVIGLMCIPPNTEVPKEYFQEMIKLKNLIDPNLLLSMGMSKDYKIALETGSNIIRIGSKIFQ